MIYIGCGSHNNQFFNGDVANVYLFDYNVSQTEITNLYLNGLEYNKTYQTKFEPVLRYEFDNFYKQILIDKSKNHNHCKFFGKVGNDYLNCVKKDTIEKTTKISLPNLSLNAEPIHCWSSLFIESKNIFKTSVSASENFNTKTFS